VEILDAEGELALGKPIGRYVTVELDSFNRKERNSFAAAAATVAAVLAPMIPDDGKVLVAGLGNGEITPDTVGIRTVENLIVTRHLLQMERSSFSGFSDVCAVCPGVLGKTGIESAEQILAVAERVAPDCVIVVDALASCEPQRLCRSVQISDTGLVPGSGVGNHRAAFTRQTFGVPVIAVGVPTVVEGHTFLRRAGVEADGGRGDLILSLRDIDLKAPELGKLIGYGLNLALHKFLALEDIPGYLS